MADFTHKDVEITLTDRGLFRASPDGTNFIEGTSLAGIKKRIDEAQKVTYKPVNVVIAPYRGSISEPVRLELVGIKVSKYGTEFVTANKRILSFRFCDADTFPFDAVKQCLDDQRALEKRWAALVDTIPVLTTDEVKRRMTQ